MILMSGWWFYNYKIASRHQIIGGTAMISISNPTLFVKVRNPQGPTNITRWQLDTSNINEDNLSNTSKLFQLPFMKQITLYCIFTDKWLPFHNFLMLSKKQSVFPTNDYLFDIHLCSQSSKWSEPPQSITDYGYCHWLRRMHPSPEQLHQRCTTSVQFNWDPSSHFNL